MAQDLVAVEPTQARVLLENERVRVLVYTLTAYRVKHIDPSGKTTLGARRAGEVVWIPAESHAGENVGTTDIRTIMVELKEPPGRS